MRTQTKEIQENTTPQQAIEILKQGNQRFVNNLKANRNLLEQVNITSEGQHPCAAILSCIDSRTSAELIFDQGLGDIFSIRIAGNFANEDIIGSMEFACKIAGAKLIVVLGHTRCGAIKGACDNVTLGNLTGLLEKLIPAVECTVCTDGEKSSENAKFVDWVAHTNVKLTIEKIYAQSPILREMQENNEIDIVGGMYEVTTGLVTFDQSGQ